MSHAASDGNCLDCLNCRHRTLRVFCDLHAEALQEFNSMGTLRAIETGAELFAESTPVRNVFVLCHGKVKLVSTSRQGKSLVLKIARPGDVLGLGAAVSGSLHEVSALATEPIQVKSIPRTDLLAFLDRHAEGGVHAVRSVSAEYESAFVGARRLALSASSAAKLASLLLEWAGAVEHAVSRSAQPGAPPRFLMPLTHEEIAGMIGSTRETVTRTLNRFKRDRFLEIRGASIVLLDVAKLQELVA
jgi:CRP/FNR family transcriptional regulator